MKTAIRVENITKRYRLGALKHETMLRDVLVNAVRLRRSRREENFIFALATSLPSFLSIAVMSMSSAFQSPPGSMGQPHVMVSFARTAIGSPVLALTASTWSVRE